MARNLGPARHVTCCRRPSGGDHGGGGGDGAAVLMIIISLTRIGRRHPDHVYDRHDSADPRGPAWAARGSTVDEAARRQLNLPHGDN